MLYVDPMARLDPIREKFLELVENNERWDGRVKHMQVTELTRDAIEVRLLMTAKDSPTLFDLRCDVREALIQWDQGHDARGDRAQSGAARRAAGRPGARSALWRSGGAAGRGIGLPPDPPKCASTLLRSRPALA